jgi:hypothetical protein
MDAMAAHQVMSKQARGSENVLAGIMSALLGPGTFWETLRSAGQTGQPAATWGGFWWRGHVRGRSGHLRPMRRQPSVSRTCRFFPKLPEHVERGQGGFHRDKFAGLSLTPCSDADVFPVSQDVTPIEVLHLGKPHAGIKKNPTELISISAFDQQILIELVNANSTQELFAKRADMTAEAFSITRTSRP